MVDAQTWLDQNYPNENRDNVTELDISNKNLVGSLNLLNFTNLRKSNFSHNKLNIYNFVPISLEEFDTSHNQFSRFYTFYGIGGSGIMPNLKRLNFSFNALKNVSFYAPALNSLDVSNNIITILNLAQTKNLTELNCSNNSDLTILYFSSLSNLNSFNCLGVRLTTQISSPFPSSLAPSLSPIFLYK
ncbi:12507_t:CDS:1 [Gigaspora margarita]|uniref:12507_t:CDS:1 n=1 Tax=Gigaspora margarita TaxID=4874 RepID=A0ABN7X1W9_GIGMA|nr:12507_t:CDS:1 [Gigaspora margarita]